MQTRPDRILTLLSLVVGALEKCDRSGAEQAAQAGVPADSSHMSFARGYPTPETVSRSYDDVDLDRARRRCRTAG